MKTACASPNKFAFSRPSVVPPRRSAHTTCPVKRARDRVADVIRASERSRPLTESAAAAHVAVARTGTKWPAPLLTDSP